MEEVARAAGERHSDHPDTAHSWLTRQCQAANDTLDDQQRQLLRPLIDVLVGTKELRIGQAARTRIERASDEMGGRSDGPIHAFVQAIVDAVREARGEPERARPPVPESVKKAPYFQIEPLKVASARPVVLSAGTMAAVRRFGQRHRDNRGPRAEPLALPEHMPEFDFVEEKEVIRVAANQR